jgi:hypothetical protein
VPEQLLTLAAEVVRCCRASPDKVADRLVDGVGQPYPCQLACPMPRVGELRKRFATYIGPVRGEPVLGP